MKSVDKDKLISEIVKSYLEEKEQKGSPPIRALLEMLLDTLMKAERDVYLKNAESNKANGYYNRSLTTGAFKLDLKVPRDRDGEFRPSILPDRWRRSDSEYQALLISLIANGYSKGEIRRTLRGLGLFYSEGDIEEIRVALEEAVEDFKARELGSDWLAVFIDAYGCNVKESGRVRKAQVYVVVGIDLGGGKELLGFYVRFGQESKSMWLEVLRDLIDRGLKRPLLVVSDDFKGLEDAVLEVFPLSDHQLCYVHLMRNIKRNLGREDASEFIMGLKRIAMAPDYELGLEEFRELCERYRDRYPRYMEILMRKAGSYLAFLKYPGDIRRFIYTTNLVESFNSLMEVMRYEKRGHFQSVGLLEVNLYLAQRRLGEGRWSKVVGRIRAHSYEIKQIFALRYLKEE